MNARMLSLPAAAAAIIALAACDMQVGRGSEDGADRPLENSAEEGTLSIDAPGFEMKVDIPDTIREEAVIDSDSKILPPGARFEGIHIQGGRDGGGDGVEMRFADSRPPRQVAEYYRGNPGGADFNIASIEPQGDGFLVEGSTSDGDAFSVRLAPGSGGGTDGRLTIREPAR